MRWTTPLYCWCWKWVDTDFAVKSAWRTISGFISSQQLVTLSSKCWVSALQKRQVLSWLSSVRSWRWPLNFSTCGHFFWRMYLTHLHFFAVTKWMRNSCLTAKAETCSNGINYRDLVHQDAYHVGNTLCFPFSQSAFPPQQSFPRNRSLGVAWKHRSWREVAMQQRSTSDLGPFFSERYIYITCMYIYIYW